MRFLTQQVVGTSFSFYTDEEIRRISVKRITNPQTFDSFNHATEGGVYDKALGPVDFGVLCPTCGLPFQECPGHLGFIELAVPVYNPTLFTLLYRLMRLKCFACHKLRIAESKSRLLKVKLMLLDAGRYEEAMGLDARLSALAGSVTGSMTGTAGSAMGVPDHEPAGGISTEADDGVLPEEKKTKGSKKGGDSSSSKKKGSGGAAAAAGGLSSKDVDALLAAEAQLLEDLERDCIAACGPDVGCGLTRDSVRYSQHIRAYREDLIKDYLASFPSKVCQNCRALSIHLRKDGYGKIFMRPLSKKQVREDRRGREREGGGEGVSILSVCVAASIHITCSSSLIPLHFSLPSSAGPGHGRPGHSL